MADRPARGRPRDAQLSERLLAGAVELVAEQGWDRLTADALAARTRAGKAAIYRRWPSVADLVAEALSSLPLVDPDEDTGSLDGDLAALLRPLTQPLRLPERAAGALVGACHHDQGIRVAMHEAVVGPLAVRLHRLVARHSIPVRQEALLIHVVQALWWERYRTAEIHPTTADVQRLVHVVLLPLTRPPFQPPSSDNSEGLIE